MRSEKGQSRRQTLKAIASGIVAAQTWNSQWFGSGASAAPKPPGGTRPKKGAGNPLFPFTPFSAALPLPPTKQPLAVGAAPFEPGAVFHGIAPEFTNRTVAERPDLNWYEAFPTKWYELRMKPTVQEIIPGVRTPLLSYDGIYPGPTFRARVGQPVVVRA